MEKPGRQSQTPKRRRGSFRNRNTGKSYSSPRRGPEKFIVSFKARRLIYYMSTSRPFLVILSISLCFINLNQADTQAEPREIKIKSTGSACETYRVKDPPGFWLDPVFDSDEFTRFNPVMEVRTSSEVYPKAARRANLPKVRVFLRLYISKKNVIKDLRIRRICSLELKHVPFRKEFFQATRNVFLKHTRILSNVFKVQGKAQPYVWDSSITFELM